ITFTLNSNAQPGTTFLDIAKNVGSTATDLNGGTGPGIPAPTNATNDPRVDGVLTITVQANQPPFDTVPTPPPPPSLLFHPPNISGPKSATTNTSAFSGARGITVTDPDTGSTITSATESGTTVTITTAAAINHLVVGQNAVVRGVAVAGYNGTFAVTAISGNTF